MKVLVAKALAENHAYSYFASGLCRALEELGHDAWISDQFVHAADGVIDLSHLTRELEASRCEAVVSFNSFFGAAILSNGASLYDQLGVKFTGWHFDHPIYAPQGLARQLRGRYSVYANPNHLRFVEAISLPGRGVTMLPGVELPDQPARPYRQRDWSIFVAANWKELPVPLWEQLPESPARSLLMGVVDRLFADREASLLDAFDDACTDLRLGARLGVDPAFDDQMIEFLRAPLTHFRHVDRISIIQNLVESGLPITICGQGWRGFLGDRPNVVFLDRGVDMRELADFYGNARVVVNLNAANGACERALQAASCGAAVVSDYSQALAQALASQSECAFFDRAQPGDVAEVAGNLLEGDRGEEMAHQGRVRVMQTGLWRDRARDLVGFLGGEA